MSFVKYRLKEVASDFGVQPKEIADIISKFYEKPKSNTQVLTDQELNVVFDYMTQKNQISSIEQVFAVKPTAPKAEAPKAEAPKTEAPKAAPQQQNRPQQQGNRPQQQGNRPQQNAQVRNQQQAAPAAAPKQENEAYYTIRWWYRRTYISGSCRSRGSEAQI